MEGSAIQPTQSPENSAWDIPQTPIDGHSSENSNDYRQSPAAVRCHGFDAREVSPNRFVQPNRSENTCNTIWTGNNHTRISVAMDTSGGDTSQLAQPSQQSVAAAGYAPELAAAAVLSEPPPTDWNTPSQPQFGAVGNVPEPAAAVVLPEPPTDWNTPSQPQFGAVGNAPEPAAAVVLPEPPPTDWNTPSQQSVAAAGYAPELAAAAALPEPPPTDWNTPSQQSVAAAGYVPEPAAAAALPEPPPTDWNTPSQPQSGAAGNADLPFASQNNPPSGHREDERYSIHNNKLPTSSHKFSASGSQFLTDGAERVQRDTSGLFASAPGTLPGSAAAPSAENAGRVSGDLQNSSPGSFAAGRQDGAPPENNLQAFGQYRANDAPATGFIASSSSVPPAAVGNFSPNNLDKVDDRDSGAEIGNTDYFDPSHIPGKKMWQRPGLLITGVLSLLLVGGALVVFLRWFDVYISPSMAGKDAMPEGNNIAAVTDTGSSVSDLIIRDVQTGQAASPGKAEAVAPPTHTEPDGSLQYLEKRMMAHITSLQRSFDEARSRVTERITLAEHRLDSLETLSLPELSRRIAAVSENDSQQQTTVDQELQPRFRPVAFRVLGDETWVSVLDAGGERRILRRGDIFNGWQLVATDLSSRSAMFENNSGRQYLSSL